MPLVLAGGLNAALSGIAHWSCDIGGFCADPALPDPELFTRWAQWGLLLSHARFHGTGPRGREPWQFGRRTFEIVKRYAVLRYRLLSYLVELGKTACATGLPVLRPMVLEFEDDPACAALSDQYMLGPSLLVKPVCEPGARTCPVYLPDGRWQHWFTRRIYRGGRYVDVPAARESLPLFQHEGSRIPLNRAAPYVQAEALRDIKRRSL
jgi:alpha-D-xyloside xylohydrolase